MKNILIINTSGWGFEGISSVIVNYISNMKKDDITINFLVYQDINSEFKTIIEDLADVYVIPRKQKNLYGYVRSIYRAMVTNKYDIVHIHGNSGTMIVETLCAKIAGIKKIIVHCHNTACKHTLINGILKIPMKKMANKLLACSEAAGKWLYGKSDFVVMKNAIDLEKFKFDKKVRSYMRAKYSISNEQFVIGHIGYFFEQKNHNFLVDIFNQICEEDKNARLLLIGDGEKRNEIIEKIRKLGLSEKVMLISKRADIQNFYQMMDIFVMPSKWEGLPLVLVEAQASGLPIVLSNNITEDVILSDNAISLDLDMGIEKWSREIIKMKKLIPDRGNNSRERLMMAGFDIKSEANKLRKIYLEEI